MGVRWSIDFGGDPQDVTVTTSGAATPQGFARMNAELVEDEQFRAGMLVLVDHTDLVVNDLTSGGVRWISDDFSRRGDLRSMVVAIVAPRPLQFGISRMSTAMADATETVRVFYTRDEAMDWLRHARDAGPAGAA